MECRDHSFAGISAFIDAVPEEQRQSVAQLFLNRLKQLLEFFQTQKIACFHGSSLLFFYDNSASSVCTTAGIKWVELETFLYHILLLCHSQSFPNTKHSLSGLSISLKPGSIREQLIKVRTIAIITFLDPCCNAVDPYSLFWLLLRSQVFCHYFSGCLLGLQTLVRLIDLYLSKYSKRSDSKDLSGRHSETNSVVVSFKSTNACPKWISSSMPSAAGAISQDGCSRWDRWWRWTWILFKAGGCSICVLTRIEFTIIQTSFNSPSLPDI